MKRHPTLSRLGLIAGAVAVTLLTALHATPAAATQPAVEEAPGYQVPLRAKDEDTFTRVAPTLRAGETRTATFTVQYSGFSAQAQAAFQSAVDIWATKVASSVPIVVRGRWEPLASGILGQAGPVGLYRNFAGAPTPAWYPAAIANRIAGQDVNGGTVEIVASFNSSYSNWYLGTDGRPSSGMYDFKTVVMHELAHGLGFVGSMDVSGGTGRCDSGTSVPFVYDPLVVNASGQTLTAAASCPAASVSLASQLQSGSLYWNGANGVAAAGGTRPRLYAPNPFQPGSSFSHLDEGSYPAGNPNSLMTPAVGRAEVIHSPGPVALGMFRDMGWAAGGPSITTPAPGSTLSGPTVTFQWSGGSNVQEYSLWVGSNPGGAQYFIGSTGLNRSAQVTGLPTNGSTIYVKLWWKVNGGWQAKDYTFTASN